ncbi:MAG: esterase [Acidobacteria bacterium]|nr:esterase [Acidobacteriota bacterium]
MKNIFFNILFCLIFLAAVISASAQSGKIINDEIHAVSLEGNLIGDSPKRSVLIYLPPNYDRQTKVRYSVVYLLHGFTGRIANKTWIIENEGLRMHIGATMNKLIAAGKISPMIVVMPDGSNKFGGSFYTNSITTGNWEDFITRDLVGYIDKKYRTLPKAASRGIAGHSMGGYGAIKLAMKHPDIYGAVYGTSTCCLDYYPSRMPKMFFEEAAAIKSWEEVEKASFFARTFLANAAAWSPNPAKPPFFAVFPIGKNSEQDVAAENAEARWLANTPMWMVDQYRTNLIQLRGIAFDVSTKEELINSIREFSEKLKRIKIQHAFEEFDGDHINKVAERIETRIMPFFSRTLVFQQSSKNASANKTK